MHVHLIGIGGTGLSAIAQVLWQRGYEVSGSDRTDSPVTQNLRAAGMQVFIGHQPGNIAGADLVLRSSAVGEDNPEIQAARQKGIPVVKRSEFLENVIGSQECIAVAGTHGKTTTTAMLAWVLHTFTLDPSYIIGSNSLNLGNNAHAGQGEYFVIEADEYDYMFLGLNPKISIVTNIEHDHPDCFPTFEDVLEAFKSFADRTQATGTLIACGDDVGATRLLKFLRGKNLVCITYGLEPGVFDYCAEHLAMNDLGGYQFTLTNKSGDALVETYLKVPGRHNVSNAVACLAVVDNLGLPLIPAAAALQEFMGTARRFELVGEVAGVTIVNDYAHHPSEIRATLAAARSRFQDRRIWAVWQPHTFSRTKALLDQFSGSFADADRILITEIFAAREAQTPDGFSSSLVARQINGEASFIPDLESVRKYLGAQLDNGDVVIILSAGDADKLGDWLVSDLSEKYDHIPEN